MVAELLVRKPRLINEPWLESKYRNTCVEVFFCVEKLATDWYLPKEVLKHLTVQSLVFSRSLTVKQIETAAVHSTIDTERNGDSR